MLSIQDFESRNASLIELLVRLVEIESELVHACIQARFPLRLVEFSAAHVNWQPALP